MDGPHSDRRDGIEGAWRAWLVWIGLAAGGIVGGVMWLDSVRDMASGSFEGSPPFAAGGEAAGLLVAAIVGRLVLSLLPPGPLGSHDVRDLASTWAASHLLGLFGVTAFATIVTQLAPDAETPGFWIAVAGPWVLLAGFRIATLPGAMVPRHDLRSLGSASTARSRGARAVLTALLALVLLLTLAAVARGQGSRLFEVATWVAALLLLDRAAAETNRRTIPRVAWTTVASLCSLPLMLPEGVDPLVPVALFALVPVGGVGWLRHADRRSLGLLSIGLGATAFLGDPALALAVAILAVAVTPAPSRRRASKWVGAGSLGGLGLHLLPAASLIESPRGGLELSRLLELDQFGVVFWVLPVAGVAAVASLSSRARATRPEDYESMRELAFLGLLVLASAAVLLVDGPLHERAALLLFSPAVLFTARALLPRRPPPPPLPLEKDHATWTGSPTPTPGSPSAP